MFGGGIAVRILAVVIFVACVFSFGATVGFRYNDSMWQSRENARLAAEMEAQSADQEHANTVSSIREAVIAELRRITAVNRVETIRETQKIEYRCPLLPSGERLRLDAIRAANAAAGFPDPVLPADPADGGAGPGGTPPVLYGADGDVR
jgi:hypothetical protein